MEKERLKDYLFLLFFCVVYLVVKNIIMSSFYNKDMIVFLDVGMGDSFLIKSKNKYLVVDGGPSFKNYNKIFKYTQGKKPTNFLITHHHSDHISGVLFGLKTVVNYDLFSPLVYNNTFQSYYLKKRITKNLFKGDSLILGNFKIDVVWPSKKCNDKNINICSVVLLVTHANGKKVLLMSDSEYLAQDEYYSYLPYVDYLKIPHQGSKDSLHKKLLNKTMPKYAILSVNKNSYGHPHKEVLDYYKKMGIKVLRTDVSGDIILIFE